MQGRVLQYEFHRSFLKTVVWSGAMSRGLGEIANPAVQRLNKLNLKATTGTWVRE